MYKILNCLANKAICAAFAALLVSTVKGAEYVWTGAAGDGKWITPGNWDVKVDDGSGEVSWEAATTYPGQKQSDVAYDYDPSTVSFTNSVELVDLSNAEGVKKTYYFTQNQPIKFSENITVKFKNGTFSNLIDHKDDRFLIGAKGTTLIFENFNFNPITVSGSGVTAVYGSKVAAVKSSILIFEGQNSNPTFRFAGDNAFTLYVRNGSLETKDTSSPGQITLWISNAVWTASGASAGVAKNIYIQDIPKDSPDYKEESRIAGNGSGLLLSGTYNIVIPKEGRTKFYVEGRNHPANGNNPTTSVTFNIDVTNWNKGGDANKIPLVYFSGTTSSFNHNAVMEQKLKNTTLKVIANGRDVTKRRNARLEWNGKNALYYVQDKPSDGFKVIVR